MKNLFKIVMTIIILITVFSGCFEEEVKYKVPRKGYDYEERRFRYYVLHYSDIIDFGNAQEAIERFEELKGYESLINFTNALESKGYEKWENFAGDVEYHRELTKDIYFWSSAYLIGDDDDTLMFNFTYRIADENYTIYIVVRHIAYKETSIDNTVSYSFREGNMLVRIHRTDGSQRYSCNYTMGFETNELESEHECDIMFSNDFINKVNELVVEFNEEVIRVTD